MDLVRTDPRQTLELNSQVSSKTSDQTLVRIFNMCSCCPKYKVQDFNVKIFMFTVSPKIFCPALCWKTSVFPGTSVSANISIFMLQTIFVLGPVEEVLSIQIKMRSFANTRQYGKVICTASNAYKIISPYSIFCTNFFLDLCEGFLDF